MVENSNLDDAGDIISYEEYHPYGTTAYQAMNAGINAVAKRYRFTGKERDEESGLNYHGRDTMRFGCVGGVQWTRWKVTMLDGVVIIIVFAIR